MALDLNKVKSRLAQLQSKGKKNADGTFEKTDYTKIYWKPRKGEQTIRIVPLKSNPSYPILEVSFHNDIIKKRYLALTNFGEKDPIVEFSKQLKDSTNKEDRDLGYKLAPKTRYFCQVLVRGEEHLGVRLWEFGSNVEKEILKLLNHKSYGEIYDVNEGTDLTVEGMDDSFSNGSGKSIAFIRPEITPERDRSPLSDKASDLQKYLDEQHDPLTLNKKYSYDEVMGFLEQWLNPEGEAEVSADPEPKPEIKSDIEDLPFVETEATDDVDSDTAEEDNEPPFIPDPPVVNKKSAIQAASKKIIEKNNAEIKASAKTVEVAEKPKAAPKASTKKITETKVVTETTSKAGNVSNKDKFAALFPKK